MSSSDPPDLPADRPPGPLASSREDAALARAVGIEHRGRAPSKRHLARLAKASEVLRARFRDRFGSHLERPVAEELARRYEMYVVDLVARLKLPNGIAVLDRPALVDNWDIGRYVIAGPDLDLALSDARLSAAEREVVSDPAALARAKTSGLWPADVSRKDLADLLRRSGDPVAEPLIEALLTPGHAVGDGAGSVARRNVGLHGLDSPEGRAALARYPVHECLLILSINRAVEALSAKPHFALPSTELGKAAFVAVAEADAPWVSAVPQDATSIQLIWRDKKVGDEERYKPFPYQLQLSGLVDVDQFVVEGILQELGEDGLRDYLCLHRMAAEQGRTGLITWTWEEHSRRTRYAHRIEDGHLSNTEAAASVTSRLGRLKECMLRFTQPEPGGPPEWRQIPLILIRYEGGRDSPSLDLAQIELHPFLYKGAHRDTPAHAKHFALVPEEILSLDNSTLRLATMLTFGARAQRDHEGLVRCPAQTLWQYARTRDGTPKTYRWVSAQKTLERQLDKLAQLQICVGSWQRLDNGQPFTKDSKYEIRPTQAWRDQLLNGVPPQLPPNRAALPRTGAELRAWRQRKGWSQLRAADELGIGLATMKRAEASASELGHAVRPALERGLVKGLF